MTMRRNLRLPDNTTQWLRSLHPGRGNKAPDDFLDAVAALHAAGWTLASIGWAMGVSRERARQWQCGAPATTAIDPALIPTPPPKPEKQRQQRRQRPQLTEAQAEQLRQLALYGQATGRMRPDDSRVKASKRLAELMNQHINNGHPLIEMARVLGITKAAVHVRLASNGFRNLPPSRRCGPGPINMGRSGN